MGAASGGGGPEGQAFFDGHYKGYSNADSEGREEYTWTVPDDVTSVSIVAVGGGEPGNRSNNDGDGGDAGGVYWANEVSATPGDTWNINVANGWVGRGYSDSGNIASTQGNGGKGQTSYVTNGSGQTIIHASGGDPDSPASSAHSSATSEGGTEGGEGGAGNATRPGGGAHAGGYDSTYPGGGRMNYRDTRQGDNGYGTMTTGWSDYDSNFAGTNDGNGLYMGTMRGYGAGGGGFNSDGSSQNSWCNKGTPGAVRIMWGGDRSFPNNAEDLHPIADAGTQLEVKLIPPFPIGTSTSTHAQNAAKHHIRMYRVEVYDPQGNELIRNLTADQTYKFDYDANESITNNSTGANTWSLLGNDEWGLIMNEDGAETALSATQIAYLSDNDRDSTTDIKWGCHNKHPNDLASMESDNYSPGSFLFKFGTAKVIKEIRFYGSSYFYMGYRCQVILDGTVIADGNFHKVDSLVNQDSSAAAAHPDYNSGDGDITIRNYWRLIFT